MRGERILRLARLRKPRHRTHERRLARIPCSQIAYRYSSSTLCTASSHGAAKATGRPGYAPADLLKLYIYGYLNRVRSSRRLEMESHRNIEVIWLLRSLKPDFKTIADFRRDNRAAFRSVFREFVLLCRRLDLYGRELLAVDGTRIKAVNNKDRNFTCNSLEKFIRAAASAQHPWRRGHDGGRRGENRGKSRPIQTGMTGLDATRSATGDFLDQNAQNALPRVARRRALIWEEVYTRSG